MRRLGIPQIGRWPRLYWTHKGYLVRGWYRTPRGLPWRASVLFTPDEVRVARLLYTLQRKTDVAICFVIEPHQKAQREEIAEQQYLQRENAQRSEERQREWQTWYGNKERRINLIVVGLICAFGFGFETFGVVLIGIGCLMFIPPGEVTVPNRLPRRYRDAFHVVMQYGAERIVVADVFAGLRSREKADRLRTALEIAAEQAPFWSPLRSSRG